MSVKKLGHADSGHGAFAGIPGEKVFKDTEKLQCRSAIKVSRQQRPELKKCHAFPPQHRSACSVSGGPTVANWPIAPPARMHTSSRRCCARGTLETTRNRYRRRATARRQPPGCGARSCEPPGVEQTSA